MSYYPMLVYACFFLGYAIHLLLQVDAQVRAKNNGASSRWQVVRQNYPVLLARLGFSLVLFWYVRAHPQAIATLLSIVGVTPTGDLAALLALPLNAPLSFVFGYEVDSLLAFIPWLKQVVPPAP